MQGAMEKARLIMRTLAIRRKPVQKLFELFQEVSFGHPCALSLSLDHSGGNVPLPHGTDNVSRRNISSLRLKKNNPTHSLGWH